MVEIDLSDDTILPYPFKDQKENNTLAKIAPKAAAFNNRHNSLL